jgi:hypothetical protein
MGLALAGSVPAAVADPWAVPADVGVKQSCTSGSVRPMRISRLAYAALAVRPLVAHGVAGTRSTVRFDTRNANGASTVFGVLSARVDGSCRAMSYHVQLPIRPNGATGWVRAVDVHLEPVRTRIVISLSDRRITLLRDGRPILSIAAAIGAPSTPTPTGHYYVNQRLRLSSPIGDYGSGAVGISAFSPVLVSWPQGGPVAIHGTNAPGLVGFAISHGCLRVRNADILQLLRRTAEGTPVEIGR